VGKANDTIDVSLNTDALLFVDIERVSMSHLFRSQPDCLELESEPYLRTDLLARNVERFLSMIAVFEERRILFASLLMRSKMVVCLRQTQTRCDLSSIANLKEERRMEVRNMFRALQPNFLSRPYALYL